MLKFSSVTHTRWGKTVEFVHGGSAVYVLCCWGAAGRECWICADFNLKKDPLEQNVLPRCQKALLDLPFTGLWQDEHSKQTGEKYIWGSNCLQFCNQSSLPIFLFVFFHFWDASMEDSPCKRKQRSFSFLRKTVCPVSPPSHFIPGKCQVKIYWHLEANIFF